MCCDFLSSHQSLHCDLIEESIAQGNLHQSIMDIVSFNTVHLFDFWISGRHFIL